ncbi:MAG: hypothetical protein U0325_31665 [Polyangiales bacterium]
MVIETPSVTPSTCQQPVAHRVLGRRGPHRGVGVATLAIYVLANKQYNDLLRDCGSTAAAATRR